MSQRRTYPAINRSIVHSGDQFLEHKRISDRIELPGVIDGPIIAEAFLACVARTIAAMLRPGDTVIIDSHWLTMPRRPGRRPVRQARSCSVPPYGPNFNPIEQAYTGSKRSSARRPSEQLRPDGRASGSSAPSMATFVRARLR